MNTPTQHHRDRPPGAGRRPHRRGRGRRRPRRLSAAVAAARKGASVTLVERYNYLGGLASGGMVLVLDDMRERRRDLGHRPLHRDDRAHGEDRPGKVSAAGGVGPQRRHVEQVGALGRLRLPQPQVKPQPIVYGRRVRSRRLEARLATRWSQEAGVDLRLHSWFSEPIVEDGVHQGRGLRDQGRPPGDPGRRRHRHHRRPRRRRSRRRRLRRRQLHGDHGVPARRRRHRRGRALRARGAARRSAPSTARPSGSSAAPGNAGG